MAITGILITDREGYGLGRSVETTVGSPVVTVISVHPVHTLKGIYFDEGGIPDAPEGSTF